MHLAWSGFRGFTQETRFDLPALTLFLGRNNVGKTSTYAPLLMLKQTLAARSKDTALLSRGPLIDAGPFVDYVSDHDTNRPVTFELGLPERPQTLRRHEEIDNLSVTFRSTDGQVAHLSRQRLEDHSGNALVSRTRDTAAGAFTVASPLLPKRISSGRPTRELTALRTSLRQEQPRGFLFDGYGGLLLPRGIRQDSERWAKVQDWYNASYELYDVQQEANEAIIAFLRGISYIGPLRSLPERTYRLAAEAPADVGSTGQFAPEVLYRLRDREQGAIVNGWLKTLGYGNLHFEELSYEYFQVLLERREGSLINIADSGVGLSQVIPLLVQAAQAQAASTLIAQQPEIHLNPAQQSILTDVFIERAKAGVRVVIESHSEHVLLRIRRRIAEGSLLPKDVAIYFVDNDEGQTKLRKINLGEAGEISRDEWPRGFFEDQLVDSFALASAQAKRKRTQ